jgi:hypothetical protein
MLHYKIEEGFLILSHIRGYADEDVVQIPLEELAEALKPLLAPKKRKAKSDETQS